MKKTTLQNYSDENGNKIIMHGECNTGGGQPPTVLFRGRNNLLEVDKDSKIYNSIIRFDSHGGKLKIGKNVQYTGVIRVGLGCEVKIGEKTTVTANCYISAAEYTQIIIGNDCMFASNNRVCTDDAHPIFEIETGQRINRSRDITIGDHVWLGFESVVLAGANIGSGSVIGMRGLVKKNIPCNTLAVGVPCKAIKENIAWERTHLNLCPPFIFDKPTGPLMDFRNNQK